MQTDITMVLEKCDDGIVIVDSFLINGTEVNVLGYEINNNKETGDIPVITFTLAPSAFNTITKDS